MKKTQLSLLIAALLTGANLYATEPAKPADAKPAEAAKPADAKPAEAAKPADAKPAEAAKPADAKPAEAAKPADAKPAEAAKPALSLSGSWSSTHGGDIITVEHKGDKFTASYEYAEDSVMYVGKIEGTVKDKAIEGTWSEQPKAGRGDSSNGDVKFTIVDDKTLLGKWRTEGSRDWDDWNLQKK